MRYRRKNTNGRILEGSLDAICERIATAYIETGRTMRSLASDYKCSPSTICNYLNKYAADHLPYSMNRQIRNRAKWNMQETYMYGQSENRYSDQVGSLD